MFAFSYLLAFSAVVYKKIHESMGLDVRLVLKLNENEIGYKSTCGL